MYLAITQTMLLSTQNPIIVGQDIAEHNDILLKSICVNAASRERLDSDAYIAKISKCDNVGQLLNILCEVAIDLLDKSVESVQDANALLALIARNYVIHYPFHTPNYELAANMVVAGQRIIQYRPEFGRQFLGEWDAVYCQSWVSGGDATTIDIIDSLNALLAVVIDAPVIVYHTYTLINGATMTMVECKYDTEPADRNRRIRGEVSYVR